MMSAEGSAAAAVAATTARPIAWTIAGSDSGGGAGIQADLLTMHDLGAHGCSVITALTAQSSTGVTHVETASTESIVATVKALNEDLPARAIKLGMLGTEVVVTAVASYLATYDGPVVCDPVMVSTSGSKLMQPAAQAQLVSAIFPRSALITPNKLEAEALLGRTLHSADDVVAGAAELLATGAKAVLIKGGHLDEASTTAQDYYTDGTNSFWLSALRSPSANTHGTGCTLSSAIAACIAQGYTVPDSVTVAKAYVTAGIASAAQLGAGPGPVAHTGWPHSGAAMPWLTVTAAEGSQQQRECAAMPRSHRDWDVYPVVDTAEWVQRVVQAGVKDVQLRVKGMSTAAVETEVAAAQAACAAAGARLWVNDYWRAAIKCGAYGVHVGQEDLQVSASVSCEVHIKVIHLMLAFVCISVK
jgi:hydroxymethylpyrimidine kinase / phosphomethylpyrimidine kinase / thiamine-phosphate diphosphorylase